MGATRQLSVRMPERLHREVKRKATEEGTSMQSFVEQALRRAVREDDREPRLSEAAADALLAFVRAGGYAEAARQIGEDEPDLATM